MAVIHFLNVLEGDCNIIQHDSGRVTVIDVSNAYNDIDTEEEKRVKASEQRKLMIARTQVPTEKKDYQQKKSPDNPILYLRKFGINDIFRFIISHPDMDHLDGIKDLYDEFSITNTWDTDNSKVISDGSSFAGYNKEDWEFYTRLRNGSFIGTKRLTLFAGQEGEFYTDDNIKILCPTPELLRGANKCGNFNDSSYVLLFTPPKSNGEKWKILFAGDSENSSWEFILEKYKEEVSNIDVLFAPHHGRDSNRNYDFLKVLNPKVTLFGNASSKYLAYDCYPKTRLTNNQCGYIIMDINESRIVFHVKNHEYAKHYKSKRGWGEPNKNNTLDAYGLFVINA